MPQIPPSTDEIEQGLVARTVARSRLSDVAEGGTLRAILRAIAEGVNDAGMRIAANRNAYALQAADISDAGLDERLAELPSPGLRRLSAVSASGSHFALTRDTSVGVQTLPAGATIRRSDNPGILYRTTNAVTFANGVQTVTGVYAICLTPGTVGNCAAGLANSIVSASPWLIGAVNTAAFSNGLDRETNAEAQLRAAAYMASLSRCQPQALQYMALSFEASDHTRVKFAKVYEDPNTAGYCELLVDDGSGLAALTQPGTTSTGTVPATGQTILWHDGPATAPIAQVSVVLASDGSTVLYSGAAGDYVSKPEQGIVIFPAGVLLPGDVWTISGYTVYTGVLAELQREVEGDPSTPTTRPGWRASGTRVVVKPPVVLGGGTSFSVHLVPVSYVDIATVQQEVVDAVVAYCGTLGPGEPLYVAKLIDRIMDNEHVLNVRIYEPGVALQPKEDVYPLPQQVVRTSAANVAIVLSIGA